MFPLPLVVETRPSAWTRRLLLAAHMAVCAGLFLADLPALARLAGCIAAAASLGFAWTRPGVPRLRGKQDGQMEIWRDGAWRGIRLRPDSVALPGLIVLRWRDGLFGRSLVLPADALDDDDHRRLRAWLRWKARFPRAPLQ